MALIGQCGTDEVEVLRVLTRLEVLSGDGVVPFVLPRDGWADYGYAASPWVLDLYGWAVCSDVPADQRDRILGLLLGYSVAAIERFDAAGAGRRLALGGESV